jgi:molybdate transport system permease protein
VSFGAPEWEAVGLSVRVAMVAVLVGMGPAAAVALLLARRDFRGKWLLEVLVSLPLVLPPVVTGYLLLVGFGRNGRLGALLHDWLGISIVFDWKGAALASGVMAFPLMVGAMRVGFAGVDPGLEAAARTLGASRWRVFRTVTLPLAWHAVVAGAVLGFARSVGEFGATIMIAGSIPGETRTIPLAVFNALETPGGLERARGLVVIAVVIAAGALVAGGWLERRGRSRVLGRDGRAPGGVR